jgi:protein SCO1/2
MGKVILIILALGQLALAQNFNSIDSLYPSEAKYIYKNVKDVKIITSENQIVSLSQFWQKKPIILTLIFSRCAGICYPLLSSLKFSIDKITGNKSEYDFYVLVLSFDTLDTPQDMKIFKENFEPKNSNDWIFGTFSEKNEIDKFAEEVGFWYKWVDSTGQYDHPGMVIGIRQGKVVRVLVGGNVTLVRLRELIDEIRGDFVPFYSIRRNVAFRCLNYDPETGKVKIGAGTIILFTPAVLTLIITLAIFGIPKINKNKN